MKKKAAVVFLLILLSVSVLFVPLSLVLGQLDVNIYLVNPTEEGTVGQNINLQGTIITSNSKYEIWFDKILVASNSSDGYYINANFAVPALPRGDYTITLRDVSENVNATYSFTLSTANYIEALVPSSPKQLQEGSDVILNVTLTGLDPGTTHYANVTVELPSPLNTSYSRIIELSVSNQGAVATAQVTYPDSAFQPEGSLTNYTGLYKVYFNKTQSLAENQFFVGFTDLRQYHRDQIVTIRAIGYQSSENATVTIKYAKNGAIAYDETVTASSEGIVNSSWAIPSDALIGNYNITITPETTDKPLPDSQLITVPGYAVKIRTLNLAGEVVPQITVAALDQATNAIYNGTSDDVGIATLNLEIGEQTISAFWKGVKVGEMNVSITGENTFDLTARLTNLEITVKNENGNLIPFIGLSITYQYVTTKDGLSNTGRASGETDLSGTFILNSVLPGIGYTVNASLYEIVFNVGNNTVASLQAQGVSEVLIMCPSKTLRLKIVDYNMAAIPNARIEMFEVTNGLFHGVITDAAGQVTVDVTFGKYKLRVYKDYILLNSTIIEVFSDTQREIHCSLYNIEVSITIVDYFNQPIPNINVVLHGTRIENQSATTQSNGETIFNNVIGGNMQIITYPEGIENSYEAVNLQIEEPTSIQIRLAKYIIIGPFLIESSILATLIVILLVIILFVSIELYRKKRAKPVKSGS